MCIAKIPAATGANMKAAAGIRWIPELPNNRLNSALRVPVSPESLHPKPRNKEPELGRRQLRPKQDHGPAYPPKPVPN
jgi:hypothetical protein